MNTNSRLVSTLTMALVLLAAADREALAGKGAGGGGGTTTITTNPLGAQAGVKIFVQQEGVYQVSRQNLIDAGWDPGSSATYLQLWAEGTQQAILVNTGGNGTFDPADTIQFYGTGIDTPSTGTRVYWLVQGSSPGLRIATVANPKGKTTTAGSSFSSTTTVARKTGYVPGIVNGSADGFYGDVVAAAPVTESINILDPAPSTANATLSVTLTGAYWWYHQVNVALNGNLAGTMTFNGEVVQTTSFPVPASWIVSGQNAVTLSAPDGGNDVSLVSSISLTYPRLFQAESNTLKPTAAGSQTLSLSGYSTPNILAFDITAPATPQQLLVTVSAGGGGYSATLTTPSSTGNRTVLAIGTDQILSPAGIVANVPSNWSATTNQANFVIISASNLVSAASTLAAARQQQGIATVVANITDVYDEFNYGEKDPQAIKNFLQYTQTMWAKAPRYVLLLGGASLDPRNFLGYGNLDLVPTQYVATSTLRTSSDDWFVDFNNDGLPDMAIGRIPVDSLTDASTVIAKTLSYGQSTGAWTKNILMAVDANDANDDFQTASANVAALVPAAYTTQSVLTGQIGGSAASAAIASGFDAGQLVVNYTGHGFEQSWSGQGIFTTATIPGLTNSSQLPFVVSIGCSTGYFQDPTLTTLSATLLAAGNGGAVAAWGSSGTPSLPGETAMNQALFSTLFNGTNPALGDAVAQAKAATTDQDARRTYIFFGDPTLKLAR